MIDAAETAGIIALPLAVVVVALALCSAHIPWLAALTGAAPLQPEDHTQHQDSDEWTCLRAALAPGRADITVSAVHADASAHMAAAVRAMSAGRRLELPPAPAASTTPDDGPHTGTGGATS